LVHHIKGRTKHQGVREQGAERGIRTKDGGRTGYWRKLRNEEFCDFKTLINIIWMNKRMRVR
jgi:hypothetical protein